VLQIPQTTATELQSSTRFGLLQSVRFPSILTVLQLWVFSWGRVYSVSQQRR